MVEFVEQWNPSTLYRLSLKAVVEYIKELSNKTRYTGDGAITEECIRFPTLVCNDLIAQFVDLYMSSTSLQARLFAKNLLFEVTSSRHCGYTKLHMKYSREAAYSSLLTVLSHKPLKELCIDCGYDVLSRKNINLSEMGAPLRTTLVSLTLKNCIINFANIFTELSSLVSLNSFNIPYSMFDCQPIEYTGEEDGWIVSSKIQAMDFSGVVTPDACIKLFYSQTSITVLRLFNVPVTSSSFILLNNLMMLDISKSVREDGGSSRENGDLMVVLSKLPCLKSLDVSCRQVSARDLQLFDPPHHRMLFLGLVNSPLCGHPDINANLISGDHKESQLLLGLELYKERHDYMKLLLFELANFQPPVIEIDRGTQALLEVCDTYPKERHILLLATASLYLYTKCDEMSTDIKRKAIWMLVDIMSKHLDYGELMQNCCICLYPYQTMEDSGFVLTKLAMVLVHLVDGANSLRTLLMALLALSKLIWWLPKPKKIWLASLGTIEITLEVLMGLNSVDPQGLQENPLDLMEAGWNILWNMTDECPENCVQFCANSGIEVTMACYQSHRQAFEDAMPSIFGALGNVVEVDGLQNKVMKQEVIEALREAITTDKHHRMSYSIGGIIANLAYNGDEFWGDVQPSRQSMLEFMVEEMQQWDLEGEIWIEFNSLRPLMKIVRSCEDKVAYWAIMTIAGLSTIRQERYCNLLHKENVITVFKEISSRTGDTSLSPSVPRLATVIVENYESFFNSQQLMDIS